MIHDDLKAELDKALPCAGTDGQHGPCGSFGHYIGCPAHLRAAVTPILERLVKAKDDAWRVIGVCDTHATEAEEKLAAAEKQLADKDHWFVETHREKDAELARCEAKLTAAEALLARRPHLGHLERSSDGELICLVDPVEECVRLGGACAK